MVRISFDELLLFRHCPARWTWQEGYKVVPKLPANELYHIAMKRMFQWILDSFLVVPPSKTQVADRWQQVWRLIAVENNLDVDDSLLRERRGHGILLRYCDDIARHPPISVHIPWSWTIKRMGVEIYGEILGVTEGRHEHPYWMLAAVPPYPRMGTSSTDSALFELPLRAFRNHARKAIDPTDISIALLDFETGGVHVVTPRQDPIPLVGIALEQMTKQLCLPSTGAWCATCPFTQSCLTHNLYPSRVKPIGKLPGESNE